RAPDAARHGVRGRGDRRAGARDRRPRRARGGARDGARAATPRARRTRRGARGRGEDRHVTEAAVTRCGPQRTIGAFPPRPPMNRPSLVLVSFALSSLSAAATAQDRVLPYPLDEPAAWRAAVAAGTRSESGAPGPRYWTDRVAYVIDAELDPATAVVRGRIEASYENRSPTAESTLWMHLRQNLHRAGRMRTRNVEVTD